MTVLENIYQSEHTPEDSDYVFDVHSDRPGSEFENVDLLAVHWRSAKSVELVAVEAFILARVSNVGARRGQSGQRVSYDPFEVHPSSQADSVSATATRVSSRAADQLSRPLASACAMAGSSSSASAMRSFSCVERGL
jgi:hypothetical protein